MYILKEIRWNSMDPSMNSTYISIEIRWIQHVLPLNSSLIAEMRMKCHHSPACLSLSLLSQARVHRVDGREHGVRLPGCLNTRSKQGCDLLCYQRSLLQRWASLSIINIKMSWNEDRLTGCRSPHYPGCSWWPECWCHPRTPVFQLWAETSLVCWCPPGTPLCWPWLETSPVC